MKHRKVCIGKIGAEIGLLILFILSHIELVLGTCFNPILTLCKVIFILILTFLIYFQSKLIGILIEEYLKENKKD